MEEIVKKALNIGSQYEDAGIKQRVRNLRALYYGDIYDTVNSHLREMFSDSEEREEMIKLSNRSVNIVKHIMNKISCVYSWGASRKWMLEEQEKDEQGDLINYDVEATATYEEICRFAEVDKTLERVNVLTNLTHDCLLRYQYTSRGHTVFPLTRDVCDVVVNENDPRVVEAVIYYTQSIDNPVKAGVKKPYEKTFYKIDAEEIKKYNGDGELIGATEPNPYAELNKNRKIQGRKIFAPFIDYHDSYRERSFWIEAMDDTLVQAQIWVCVWLTYLNHQLKRSTFKQVWAASDTELNMPDQVQSPLYIVEITGANATTGMYDYTVDIGNTVKTLQGWLAMFAETKGLPSNTFQLYNTQEPGVSIKLNQDVLREFRSQQVKQYKDAECVLAEYIQYATNKFGTKKRIDNNLNPQSIQVQLGQPQEDFESEEKRNHWDWLLRNELASRVDYLMAKNSAMSREQAEREVEIIHERNLKKMAEETQAKQYGIMPSSENITNNEPLEVE